MESLGISTRPIKLIGGKSPFCETFFDKVKFKENLVGKLNEGWTIAKYLLTHERKMIGGVGETDKKESIKDEALNKLTLTNGVLDDKILRSKISEFEMNEHILTLYKDLWMRKKG